MACAPDQRVRRRVSRAVAADPRSMALCLLGPLTAIAGVVTARTDLSLPLVVMGTGMVVLGLLTPTLSEFEFGPSGIKLKPRAEQAITQRVDAVVPEVDERLSLLALLLCGDPGAAADLAAGAVGAVASSRVPTSVEHVHHETRCWLVRSFLDAWRDVADAPPESLSGTHAKVFARLAPLDAHERAAWLLAVWEAMPDDSVAEIIRVNVRDARRLIARAKAVVLGLTDAEAAS